jgi:hypothetical protein
VPLYYNGSQISGGNYTAVESTTRYLGTRDFRSRFPI